VVVSDGRASRTEIVRSAADEWADALVDLSHRNGLVCYRDSKTTTLDFTDAKPEVLSGFLAGRKTRLAELYPDPEQHARACTRARNLRRKILEFDEEQGVEVGHVACGLVNLDPPTTRGPVPVPPLRAPLLLRPFAVHARTASETDFTVELHSDIEPNPVLLYVLDRTRGMTVDRQLEEGLRAAIAEFDDPLAQAKQVFRVLAEVLSRHGLEAQFEERVIAGIFSFEKMPMVKDLRESTDLLAGHDIITSIAGYPAAAMSEVSSDLPGDPDAVTPRDELIVLDADASQHAAISAALSGKHVLIDGPPGTGKSQTIANIIACLAGSGRRVLFVSEKRAAIEAVTQRLGAVDLAHLVFDLHDKRISRRYVAGQLAKGLERASRETEPQLADLHQRLSARRADLRRYATELHEEHHPWRISFYEALCGLQDLPTASATSVRLKARVLAALDADRIVEAEAS
jgi:hypothetical protein